MSDAFAGRLRALHLLYRFFRLAVALGRVPSLLGREFGVQSGPGHLRYAFEDEVLFVCDVERCLQRLPREAHSAVLLNLLGSRSARAAARHAGRHHSSVNRWLSRALDLLYADFCRCGLLTPIEEPRRRATPSAERTETLEAKRKAKNRPARQAGP
jgi:hypothetical protein